MRARKIKENIYSYPYVDWDRRLFDSLIPLPDGTSYNSYLVKGKDKSALIDSADPKMLEDFQNNLKSIQRLDYIIANHAEQDHSGLIPVALEKFPDAKLLCTDKCKGFLKDLLHIEEEKFQPVEDGETRCTPVDQIQAEQAGAQPQPTPPNQAHAGQNCAAHHRCQPLRGAGVDRAGRALRARAVVGGWAAVVIRFAHSMLLAVR